MTRWSVSTEELKNDPCKAGGQRGGAGYQYQEAFACLELVRLLESNHRVAVRYECGQDVDIAFDDGRDEWIQLKNEPEKRYTLAELRPILQRFADDLLRAGRPQTLAFRLVARSNNVDAAVARLRHSAFVDADVEEIAKGLDHSPAGSPALQRLLALDPSTRLDLVHQLLRQTTFDFGAGDMCEGVFSFESEARRRLVERHGVLGTDATRAYADLATALSRLRELDRPAVEAILRIPRGLAAVANLDRTIEVLTEELLSNSCSGTGIERFYSTPSPRWDIIAADADIRRDIAGSLFDRLTASSDDVRLFCLTGEPGAGKSTLARRLAADLLRRGELVLRARATNETAAIYALEEVHDRVGCRFYVVIDDIFRDPSVGGALAELPPTLPVTIIGTSRTNEYRVPALTFSTEKVPLMLSEEEKLRLLERLGRRRENLTPPERARFEKAHTLLILMIELTKGQAYEQVIHDFVERLRETDPDAHRACEYLCFVCSRLALMPTTLLERLDSTGRFYNLISRDSVQGFVYEQEGRAGTLSLAHPLIAQIAARSYHRDPATLLTEIVNAVDVDDAQSRRCIGHLLRILAQAGAAALKRARQRLEPMIRQCQEHASTTGSELAIWSTFHTHLSEITAVDRCIERAFEIPPANPAEVHSRISMFIQAGRVPDLVPLLEQWLIEQPDDQSIRSRCLRLLLKHGSPTELAESADAASAWLEGHRRGGNDLISYLGSIKEAGLLGPTARLLTSIAAWLDEHPDHTRTAIEFYQLVAQTCGHARACEWLTRHPSWSIPSAVVAAPLIAHLTEAEAKGTWETVFALVTPTADWIARNPDVDAMRAFYLGFVARHGTANQVAAAIDDAAAELDARCGDVALWTAHLGLVEAAGSDAQVREALARAGVYLAGHPEDISIRTRCLVMLEHRGTQEQLAAGLDATSAWLDAHVEDIEVRACYLRVLEAAGSDRIDAELHAAREWLAAHARATNVWLAYIALLKRRGSRALAAIAAREAFAHNPRDRNLLRNYLGSGFAIRDDPDLRRVLEEAVKRFPRDLELHAAYAQRLADEGAGAEARAVLAPFVGRAPNNASVHLALGKLLNRLGEREAATSSIRRSLALFPQDPMAHLALGQALLGLRAC